MPALWLAYRLGSDVRMTTCPQCGRPLLPCCRRCPAAGHDARCQSEEARALGADWQEREDGATRAVGETLRRRSLFERFGRKK